MPDPSIRRLGMTVVTVRKRAKDANRANRRSRHGLDPAAPEGHDGDRRDREEAGTMTAGDDICRMDASSLAREVAAKQLSPVEVVDAVLDRLDRLDPRLHIFATVSADRARQEAKRLEAEIAAGREVGPLAGVPTGVKDLIYTKGIRTASGSNAYADFVPD